MNKHWIRFIPAIFGLLIYLSTIGHGFVLDDNLVITENDLVNQGVSAIPQLIKTNYGFGHQGFNDGLYRPLSLVSFALEKSIFNLNPSVSHFINAALYGLLILFLFNWIEKLFENRNLALFSTLIFALHPIHTEVVSNLKSRDEILALLFLIWSSIYLIKYLETKNIYSIISSLTLYFFALFSKESSITFLAIFPLMIWFKKSDLKMTISSAYFIIPTLSFLMVRYWILSHAGELDDGVSNILQNPLIENDGIFERLGTAAAIQWLYISKLFMPLHFSSDYSFSAIPVSPFNSLESILGIILISALLAYSIYNFKQKSPVSFGILFYFITISVVANLFILIGAIAAERFLFTPSVGWAIALAYLISNLKFTRFQISIMAVILILFAVQTMNRAADWKSNFSLFTKDVNVVDQSARAHYNAGTVYNEEAGKIPSKSQSYRELSIYHLSRAIEIWPEYQDAYNNLSITYLQSGRYADAMNAASAALNLNPNYSKGYYNLAVAALNAKDYAVAEHAAEKYINLSGLKPDMLFIAADAEGFQGKFEESMAHLNELIALEPSNFRGFFKLGMASAITGQQNQSLNYFKTALALSPNNLDVLYHLALVHLNLNEKDLALEYIQKSLEIAPQHKPAIELLQQIK